MHEGMQAHLQISAKDGCWKMIGIYLCMWLESKGLRNRPQNEQGAIPVPRAASPW